MADTKTSLEATAAALSGSELFRAVQSGGNVKVTSTQVKSFTDASNTFSKSADYTFILSDANTVFIHPSSDTSARTFTIPAIASVAFVMGTAITIINQNSAGVITISITTDTLRLAGTSSTGSRVLAANGICTAIYIGGNEWNISGVGLS